MSLLGLLVVLVVFCLAWWAIHAILRAFGVGDPIATVVKVIFVVIAVLWLVSTVMGVGPTIRLR